MNIEALRERHALLQKNLMDTQQNIAALEDSLLKARLHFQLLSGHANEASYQISLAEKELNEKKDEELQEEKPEEESNGL